MGLNLYTSFANLAANGNTSSVPTAGEFNSVGAFLGTGVTFGSGTLKAQVSFDGGTTWLDVPSASFTSGTANTKRADYTVIGPLMRWNLAGATTPSLDLRQVAREVRRGVQRTFTFTANGSSVQFPIGTTGLDVGFAAWGTWGSGTLAFQVSPDGGTTWFNVDTLTADGIKHIAGSNSQEVLARVTLTGATSPSLTCVVVAPNGVA